MVDDVAVIGFVGYAQVACEHCELIGKFKDIVSACICKFHHAALAAQIYDVHYVLKRWIFGNIGGSIAIVKEVVARDIFICRIVEKIL